MPPARPAPACGTPSARCRPRRGSRRAPGRSREPRRPPCRTSTAPWGAAGVGRSSSRMVCDNGTTGAPVAPCTMRHTTRASSDWARPHRNVATEKLEDSPDHHALGAEAGDQPSRHRRHHRGGQDIEGHDPGDLVLGGRQGALHLRQDGRGRQQRRGIERSAQHHGRQNHIALGRRQAFGGSVGVHARGHASDKGKLCDHSLAYDLQATL